MSSPSAPITVSLLGALTLLAGAIPEPQNAASADEEIQKLIADYVLAADESDDERVTSRKPLLGFNFRVTNKSGGYLLMDEKDWEGWERGRDGAKPLTLLELVGRPTILEKGNANEREVYCAVRISQSESAPRKEELIFRGFRVQQEEDESWKIVEERSMARRAGGVLASWKEFKQLPAKNKEVSVRSTPAETRSNVIGSLKQNDEVQIWVQEDERWLVVEQKNGTVGFLDREEIEWEVAEEPKKKAPRLLGKLLYASPVPGRDGYVFNPHTNGIVNVKGVPGGMLVRDPNDPDPSHVFRVPFFAAPARALVVQE